MDGQNPWAAPHQALIPQQYGPAGAPQAQAHGPSPSGAWAAQGPQGWWAPPPAAPRTTGRRLAILAAFCAAWGAAAFVVLFALAMIPFIGVDPGDYAGGAQDAAYRAAGEAALADAWPAILAGWSAVMLAAQLAGFAYLARRVGYRRVDTLRQLVPFYGLYWAFLVLWRWTDVRRWRAPAAAVWAPPARQTES